MAKFVLEIGSEEIPARFLAAEEKALLEKFAAGLETAGLAHGAMKVMATPRRLVLMIDNVAARQPEREEVIMGPPAVAAYDQAGEPTKALLGFASANGVKPDEVFRDHTEKGEYVACRKKTGGAPASEVLAALAAEIIPGMPFAKSMRWGENHTLYARPLRWILALLDSEVVPFTVAPITSGRETFGHRVHGIGPFEVKNACDYENIVAKKGAVIIDPQKRREIIREQGDRLAAEKGGRIIWKDSLLEETAGLVEHPVPIMASFDPAYLEAPPEALLTSMETHQKSFGVEGADGKLLPYFLTVLNIDPQDIELVRAGWERVLRARLEDARFFWRQDIADSFDDWLKKLDQVIFIGPLGSMGEKSLRLQKLCEWLANELAPKDLSPAQAARAGLLAKADLVSAMVGEFDTLQGIMGGIYAAKAGEPEVVAKALQEQYLPSGPDSPLPQTPGGAILSMADKADVLAGCFGLNMIPSGAADPNGLRRCALGIIRILIARGWRLDVSALFAKARELYGERKWKLDEEESRRKLLEFFGARLRNYFVTLGYDAALVDAVVSAASVDPADAKTRLDALAAFSGAPDYVQAAQTLKRVENMARKAARRESEWNDNLLREDAEKALARKLAELLPRLDAQLAKGEYNEVLDSLRHLREPVDSFFDNVLVLCDEIDIRENRLKMLNAISERFGRIAAFALLQI